MSDMLQELGKYRIIEEIGSGSAGIVFRAEDTFLRRQVALKILHPYLLQSPRQVQQFHQEAQLAASLDHEHIIKIFDAGNANGRLYIVMYLVTGKHLRDYLAQRKQLDWTKEARIFEAICSAAEYAHSLKIIHCDLKPSNIMVTAADSPIITDFGLARITHDASVTGTRTSTIYGSPPYIAPELWDGEKHSIQSDIYALGCILFELITGQPLFGGATLPQLLRAHDRGAQLPTTWPAGTPAGIHDLIASAVRKEPGQRFSSVSALIHALRALNAPPGARTISRKADGVHTVSARDEQATPPSASGTTSQPKSATRPGGQSDTQKPSTPVAPPRTTSQPKGAARTADRGAATTPPASARAPARPPAEAPRPSEQQLDPSLLAWLREGEEPAPPAPAPSSQPKSASPLVRRRTERAPKRAPATVKAPSDQHDPSLLAWLREDEKSSPRPSGQQGKTAATPESQPLHDPGLSAWLGEGKEPAASWLEKLGKMFKPPKD